MHCETIIIQKGFLSHTGVSTFSAGKFPHRILRSWGQLTWTRGSFDLAKLISIYIQYSSIFCLVICILQATFSELTLVFILKKVAHMINMLQKRFGPYYAIGLWLQIIWTLIYTISSLVRCLTVAMQERGMEPVSGLSGSYGFVSASF